MGDTPGAAALETDRVFSVKPERLAGWRPDRRLNTSPLIHDAQSPVFLTRSRDLFLLPIALGRFYRFTASIL